jgi:hypothetical protein
MSTPPPRYTFWRGPLAPIALIGVMVFLHGTRYRETIAWMWPIEDWTMYEHRGPARSTVRFRRFVIDRADGRREQVNLGRAATFLGQPYRLDYGLRRSTSEFLIICLRELRRREGDDIVALTLEKRTWDFDERSLEDHYANELANVVYRVTELVEPPAELRAAQRAGASSENLLFNGDFARFDRKAGVPERWTLAGSWQGMAADLDGKERALYLPAAPSRSVMSQTVALPTALAAGPAELKASVLVRATAEGATLELELRAPTGKWQKFTTPAPADGEWHRIEVVRPVDAGAANEVRFSLRSTGKGDVYFDDAVLLATPGTPAGAAGAAPTSQAAQ